MNYKKIYDALVEKAKVRGLDKSQHEGYFEIHHIVPRCLGGSDESDNLVMFTGREHYISHMLLWKMDKYNKSLAYAARWMSLREQGFSRLNSWLYEKLKSQTDPRPKLEKSPRFVDKTGMVFGKLRVVSLDHWKESWGGRLMPMWLCSCDCGGTVIVRGQNLNDKGTKSCGCYNGHALITRAAKLSKSGPWERSKTPDRWTRADYFYQLWKELGCPDTGYKLSTLVNLNKNTEYHKTYFNKLVSHFKDGWNPLEDEKWITFKNNYLEDG
jgi:hypothetical protein